MDQEILEDWAAEGERQFRELTESPVELIIYVLILWGKIWFKFGAMEHSSRIASHRTQMRIPQQEA